MSAIKSAAFRLALGLSAPVLAVPAASSALAQSRTSPGAPADQRIDQRISELHQRLQITQTQEPAWQAFAAVMKQNMQGMATSMAGRREKFETMNAVQDLQDYASMTSQEARGLDRLIPPFQTLYAQFSPDQKTVADQLFRNYTARGPRHG